MTELDTKTVNVAFTLRELRDLLSDLDLHGVPDASCADATSAAVGIMQEAVKVGTRELRDERLAIIDKVVAFLREKAAADDGLDGLIVALSDPELKIHDDLRTDLAGLADALEHDGNHTYTHQAHAWSIAKKLHQTFVMS